MDYLVVGLNHKTAPLELREKLAMTPEKIKEQLTALKKEGFLKEVCILSTCNRVEVYGVAVNPQEALTKVAYFLNHQTFGEKNSLSFYQYQSQKALTHLFRVASSLDSMIIGEPQITGQVKQAFQLASEVDACGDVLNKALSKALFVSKKVRNETTISERPVSVGSAGVDLAKRIFGDLDKIQLTLVGAGEMGEQVLKSLISEGVETFWVVNRTLQKAQDLVQNTLGQALTMDELIPTIQKSDVVITSVGGDAPLVTYKMINSLLAARKYKPLFFIDLGVPRNVDPQINDLDNVYVYNIDDLQKVVANNLELRKSEAWKAEEIVEKEVSEFCSGMVREHPTISHLNQKFEKIRKLEVEKTNKKQGHWHDQDRQALEKCTQAIVNKILHDPILALKSDEEQENDWNAHVLLRKIFKLDE